MRTSISTTSGAERDHRRLDLVAVGALADDVEVVLGRQDAKETGADEGLVVDEQDPDQGATSAGDPASTASTSHPSPTGPARHEPPSASARSRMPNKPVPLPGSTTRRPPLLLTVTCTGSLASTSDAGAGARSVPHHVGERFLHDPVERQTDLR